MWKNIQHKNNHFIAIIQEQPVLAYTRSQELDNYVGAKFYCPHALADGI